VKKKTLLLLRHAKSSWNDPELEDYDRPLNSRGRKAAKRIGLLMRDEGLTPNLVLCSTAQRTRETADLVYAESDSTPEVVYRDDLYHAEPKQIARVLSQIEQSV
jgi:phosphohistidine phosphatase